MQEELENKTFNVAISTTKLTFRSIAKGVRAMYRKYKTAKNEKPAGKQTIEELIGQNQGVSSIPVDQTDLKGFEKVAKKYGVDFAIVKDKNVDPPKYTVFFKARDADALTAAVGEYTNQRMHRDDRPSVLETLRKLVSRSKEAPDRDRHRAQERDR